MLPHAAGFIDPLHSTGIAHTLTGVQRLARILTAKFSMTERTEALSEYSVSVIDEIRLIDGLVEGCYAALPNFDLFCDWSMLYFAAVTSMEQSGNHSTGGSCSFLRASDDTFRSVVREARQRLGVATDRRSSRDRTEFRHWLKSAIAPWNHVGLLDDDVDGLYSSTAAR